jgi:hypothetical protein
MQVTGRTYDEKGSGLYHLDMKGGEKIHKGTIVCLNAVGLAVMGAEAVGLKAVGVATENADNTNGPDRAKRIEVRRDRLIPFEIDPADPVTLADYGEKVFIADNNTVSKTDNTGARSVAGILRDATDSAAWVEFI